ncbi:MAG: acyltransferase [Oscillospiraceae bacterium]|nr:acyltransferase [Oscillospiraceae bacterium]
MSTNKSVYKYVDLFKLFLAIVIILMHLNMFEHLPFGQLLKTATARLGVKYFFLASGFFFTKSLYTDGELSCGKDAVYSKLKKYVKRLAVMLAVMEPINIVLRVVEYFLDGVEAKEILIRAVRSVVFYPWGALWFLQACIVAALIITPFIVRRKEELLIVPALVIYALLLLFNRYFFLIEGTAFGNAAETITRAVGSTRNGLTVGFPFMLAGVLIAKHRQSLFRRLTVIRAVTIISWIGLLAESAATESLPGLDDRGMFICLIPLIPALFVTTATIPFGLKKDTVTARNLSTSIYLLHSPIYSLVTIFQILLLKSSSGSAAKAAAVIVLIAITVAVVYRNRDSKAFHYLT